MAKHHIGLFMYTLGGGGVPRRNVTLANALASAGHRVDLIVIDARGELRATLRPEIRVFELGRWLTGIPFIRAKRRRQFSLTRRKLARYLSNEKPSVLFSADNYANLAAIAAREIAKSAIPLVISQRNNASASIGFNKKLVRAIRRDYPKADAIVTVSEGVASDLISLGLPSDKVLPIYNALIDERFEQAVAARAEHPWFAVPGRPLVLGAGRIGRQKDFEMMLRAFAKLREALPTARLIILGDGREPSARRNLKNFAETLGLGDVVDMPGRVADAVPFIARADLFVLSSRWEGLPGVLIEALGCGTPIVSTDCPSGPFEILDGGAYGRLTPVGDAEALAGAMAETLASPLPAERLKSRAQLFTTEAATARYVQLFDRLAVSAVAAE